MMGLRRQHPAIDLLFDDIFLLDSAISMIDQLVPQIAAAWNDRHSISDMLLPPVQQDHAGAAGLHGVTHTPVSYADTLYTKSSQKHPDNNNPDEVSLCHLLSLQSSRRDLEDGLLPWHSILTGN